MCSAYTTYRWLDTQLALIFLIVYHVISYFLLFIIWESMVSARICYYFDGFCKNMASHSNMY